MPESAVSLQDQREYKLVEDLEKAYRESILTSLHLAEMIADRRTSLPESTSPDPKAYPPCTFKWFELLETTGIPVYHFSYEGMLPLYSSEKGYQKQLRDYYTQATIEALGQDRPQPFEQAILLICHFFQDLRVRDLDNRNRRHLINALRAAQIIEDDSWKKISVMEFGLLDSKGKNHVEMFVTSVKNTADLVRYVESDFE